MREENMKVVVTMTSWKKRIEYVAEMIEYFFKTQIALPDIFYLWLATPEFPNKEKDLPLKLLEIIKKYKVELRWTEKNDRNFKRWYVYPEHYNDIVVSIDDDTYFDKNIISVARKMIFPINTTFNLFKEFSYGYKFNNNIRCKFDKLFTNKNEMYKNNFLSCCIIPPKTFPLEAVKEENLSVIHKYMCRCDESYLQIFFNKNKTIHIPIEFKNKLYPKISNTASSVSFNSRIIRELKCSKRDLQLYIYLNNLDVEYKECWIRTFPEYNDKIIKQYSIDKLMTILKSDLI